jgi:hypothetical protein
MESEQLLCDSKEKMAKSVTYSYENHTRGVEEHISRVQIPCSLSSFV